MKLVGLTNVAVGMQVGGINIKAEDSLEDVAALSSTQRYNDIMAQVRSKLGEQPAGDPSSVGQEESQPSYQ